MSAMLNYFWIALAVILVLLDLWAIVSVFRSDRDTGAKTFWSLVIAVLPVVGLIAWGIAGPRGVVEGPTSPEHSKG